MMNENQQPKKGKVGDVLLRGDNSATLIGFGLQSEENFEQTAFGFGAGNNDMSK